MAFWQLVFNKKWVTVDQIRLDVITEANPFGRITSDEFKNIINEEF